VSAGCSWPRRPPHAPGSNRAPRQGGGGARPGPGRGGEKGRGACEAAASSWAAAACWQTQQAGGGGRRKETPQHSRGRAPGSPARAPGSPDRSQMSGVVLSCGTNLGLSAPGLDPAHLAVGHCSLMYSSAQELGSGSFCAGRRGEGGRAARCEHAVSSSTAALVARLCAAPSAAPPPPPPRPTTTHHHA
jgi:hypothetical protein